MGLKQETKHSKTAVIQAFQVFNGYNHQELLAIHFLSLSIAF